MGYGTKLPEGSKIGLPSRNVMADWGTISKVGNRNEHKRLSHLYFFA